MSVSNRDRLNAYVDDGLARARSLAPSQGGALLQRSAAVVRRHLGALQSWAAEPCERPCPPHLLGLTAFDLADAAERLEAEAVRCSAAAPSARAEA